jgi:hypothetical protein
VGQTEPPSVALGILFVLGGLCGVSASIIGFADHGPVAGVSLLIGGVLLGRRGVRELERWMNL